MSEVLEQLKQEIAQLSETVRDHKADPTTIDKEALAETLNELLDKRDAEREEPLRKGYEVGETVPTGKFKGLSYGDIWLVNALMEANARGGHGPGPSNELLSAMKAMTSSGSGTGDELVPQHMAAAIWDDIHLASKIAALFPRIPMPTNPFDEPANLGDVTFRKGSENTTTTATDLATKKMTLTADELVGEVDWSYVLEEDAIIAMMPEVRSTLSRNGAEALDYALLNGDTTTGTTNINLNEGTASAVGKYMLFDGLRHLGLVDNTAQTSNINAAPGGAEYAKVMKDLAKYAADPSRCAFIVDIWTYLASLGDSDFLTFDKLGPQATLLSGQLGQVYGVPIIVSGEMAKASADGFVHNTASNNTTGSIVMVHRDMWHVGFRRELLIEVDRDIQKRQHIMVVSLRPAFQCYGGDSTNRTTQIHTAIGYNVTIT
jgi:HK97 family phage major capsid protein